MKNKKQILSKNIYEVELANGEKYFEGYAMVRGFLGIPIKVYIHGNHPSELINIENHMYYSTIEECKLALDKACDLYEEEFLKKKIIKKTKHEIKY